MLDFNHPDRATHVRFPPNSAVVGARFGTALARQNSGKMKLWPHERALGFPGAFSQLNREERQ